MPCANLQYQTHPHERTAKYIQHTKRVLKWISGCLQGLICFYKGKHFGQYHTAPFYSKYEAVIFEKHDILWYRRRTLFTPKMLQNMTFKKLQRTGILEMSFCFSKLLFIRAMRRPIWISSASWKLTRKRGIRRCYLKFRLSLLGRTQNQLSTVGDKHLMLQMKGCIMFVTFIMTWEAY